MRFSGRSVAVSVATCAVALGLVAAAPASATLPAANTGKSVAEQAAEKKVERSFARKAYFCRRLKVKARRKKCLSTTRKQKLEALRDVRLRFHPPVTPPRGNDTPPPTPSSGATRYDSLVDDVVRPCASFIDRYDVRNGTLQLRLKPAVAQTLADTGGTLVASAGATYDATSRTITFLVVDQTSANRIERERSWGSCTPIEGSTSHGALSLTGRVVVDRAGTQQNLLLNPRLNTQNGQLMSEASVVVSEYGPSTSAQRFGVVVDPFGSSPDPTLQASVAGAEVGFSESARTLLGFSTPATAGDAELAGSVPLARIAPDPVP